ncbi:MAG TPA: hypothetical protein VMS93_02165, partial [Candidatus Saccharimonadales bacterium]|nr:hypothetical protein [Candidatus Saccharimonadales bacterium]
MWWCFGCCLTRPARGSAARRGRAAQRGALAALALAALAASAPPAPAGAGALVRALGARSVSFRAHAADSVAVLPDRRLLAGTDSVWVDGRLLERGTDYRLAG